MRTPPGCAGNSSISGAPRCWAVAIGAIPKVKTAARQASMRIGILLNEDEIAIATGAKG
jgi:hypothetical protein